MSNHDNNRPQQGEAQTLGQGSGQQAMNGGAWGLNSAQGSPATWQGQGQGNGGQSQPNMRESNGQHQPNVAAGQPFQDAAQGGMPFMSGMPPYMHPGMMQNPASMPTGHGAMPPPSWPYVQGFPPYAGYPYGVSAAGMGGQEHFAPSQGAGHGPMYGAMNGQGQRSGMTDLMQEIANGGNGLSSLSKLLDFDDKDFWKGALVGAAVVLLLTNESVQSALFRGAVKGREAIKDGVDAVKEGVDKAKAKVKETVCGNGKGDGQEKGDE